ncbi:MAG TPA: hypothetical protein VM841_00855 [Actinomycetota bacterium]|nr:hypothetical protein [Actinomycetota bacterium]
MSATKGFSVGAGAVLAGLGLWAFFSPATFYEFATYPPYNPHFIRDVGAFMTGLGAVLILAGFFADALTVALGGNTVGAAVHGISHLIDRELGGGSWRDPVLTLGFAAVLGFAVFKRRQAIAEGAPR